MADSDTCWTVIEGAARGSREHRDTFARRYLPAVRAYLRARWRGSPLAQEADDAVQDVFVECFRGALARKQRGGSAFRPYLYGIARNVARRAEDRRGRRRENPALPFSRIPSDEASLSEVFDRAWAESVLARAREIQAEAAGGNGDAAARRIELLRLRHEDDVPIREIARRWGVEASWLHHQYARARDEFRRALLAAVAFEISGTPGEVARECAHLVSFFR